MKKIFFLFIVLTFAQYSASQALCDSIKVVSYNVENLFDCIDDSLTNDAEYLPGNIRGWSYERYKTKINHISRVICNTGGWNPPAIIGLCEVESDKCLRDLTRYSGLKNLGYKYVHFESPDMRGVDVAMLYQPSSYRIISSKPIKVQLTGTGTGKTRDILYCKGILTNKDTLHIFVCHFPSRLGGELESEYKRNEAAGLLKTHTDSILKAEHKANILIMGDFNDYPTNESILETLAAHSPDKERSNTGLYNMAAPLHKKGKGTHKDNGEWGMLDQIIVSGNLLLGEKLRCGNAVVYEADFLLEKDKNYLGLKPFRTYNGMQYQDGYSDHLPVYIDLYFYR